jgi:hypothetical protein
VRLGFSARDFCWIGIAFWTLPGVAFAKSVHLNSVWVVEELEPANEPVWLKPGELLTQARLLPPSLAILKEPLVNQASPANTIAAGTQLFGLLDGNIWQPKPPPFPIFCEVSGKKMDTSGKGPFYRRCFVDRDNDAVFEGEFSQGTCFADFPLLANVDLPKKMTSLAVRYENVAPSKIENGPTVGIVFDGFNYLNGGPRFFRVFGSGAVIPSFGRQSQKKSKDGEQELFGASFSITSVEDKVRVQVKMNRSIPQQVFAMNASGPGC